MLVCFYVPLFSFLGFSFGIFCYIILFFFDSDESKPGCGDGALSANIIFECIPKESYA